MRTFGAFDNISKISKTHEALRKLDEKFGHIHLHVTNAFKSQQLHQYSVNVEPTLGGDWGVYVVSPDNKHLYRPKVFIRREDAVAFADTVRPIIVELMLYQP